MKFRFYGQIRHFCILGVLELLDFIDVNVDYLGHYFVQIVVVYTEYTILFYGH